MMPSPSLSHETSLDFYTNEFRDRKQPQNTRFEILPPKNTNEFKARKQPQNTK